MTYLAHWRSQYAGNVPPPERNGIGEAQTGALRIRPSWFGFAVVEEQIEDNSGCRFWRRIQFPLLISNEPE